MKNENLNVGERKIKKPAPCTREDIKYNVTTSVKVSFRPYSAMTTFRGILSAYATTCLIIGFLA